MAERIIQVNLKKSTSISIASHACTALLKRIPLVYKDMRSGSACSRSAAPSHSRTYPKHCTPKSMARASQPPSQPARPPARRLPASQAAPPSSQPSGMSRSCSCQARQPKAAHRHSQFATRTYGFCQKCFPKNGSKNSAVLRQENVAVFWQHVTKHDRCRVSSHVARKRQRFLAEKRRTFCCRFSASIYSKISKAVCGFANIGCRKTATKTLPFFGKAGAGLAPIAFLITPPTVALGTSVRP